MSNQDHLHEYFENAQKYLMITMHLPSIAFKIDIAAQLMVNTIQNGGKILSCGNGGSLSDSIHFASELSGKYKERRKPFAAIALSDVGAMSCIANDYTYDYVFERQVIALGRPGDILLAISTSGKSRNVIQAIEAAAALGMQVIGLTGDKGMDVNQNLLTEIRVPCGTTNHTQELHIKIIHILVELIEKSLL